MASRRAKRHGLAHSPDHGERVSSRPSAAAAADAATRVRHAQVGQVAELRLVGVVDGHDDADRLRSRLGFVGKVAGAAERTLTPPVLQESEKTTERRPGEKKTIRGRLPLDRHNLNYLIKSIDCVFLSEIRRHNRCPVERQQ